MIESDHIAIPDPDPHKSMIRFPVVGRMTIEIVHGLTPQRRVRLDNMKIDTGSAYTCLPLIAAWSLYSTKSRPTARDDAEKQLAEWLDRIGASPVTLVQANGQSLYGRRLSCVIRVENSSHRPPAGVVLDADITFAAELNEPVAGQNGFLEHLRFTRHEDHSVLTPFFPARLRHVWGF